MAQKAQSINGIKPQWVLVILWQQPLWQHSLMATIAFVANKADMASSLNGWQAEAFQ
jgi:hypothetical protein